MSFAARNAASLSWRAIALLAVSALALWLPALWTPFWGDDYVFLHAARATNAGGAPWWSDFWPSSPVRFWRPLSQEGYWRVVDAVLHGNAFAAHTANLALHVLASLGVALLGHRVARACAWPHAGRIAALAGLAYAGLTMHLLPVHWVAAANTALLTLFTTLSLAAWVSARDARGTARTALLASVPVSLALALLCKESAALTPGLMLVASGFIGMRRPKADGIVAWWVAIAVVIAWLALRGRFVANTDAAYELGLGPSVLRNAASFAAWLLNVPREALRMIVVGDRPEGLAWLAATAVPMLAAWTLALWGGRASLAARQWLALPVFAVLAYAPYFLFAWNSYEYYAAVAVVLPVIAMARGIVDTPRAPWVAVLMALSSWIAVEGTRRLDHPGLLGRARWAESTLQALERQPAPALPLHVSVADGQRFYAIGAWGLAWRLDLPLQRIDVARECAPTGTCLVIEDDGRWRWRAPE